MKKVITAIVLATALGTASARGFYDNAITKQEDIKTEKDVENHCQNVWIASSQYIAARALDRWNTDAHQAVDFLIEVELNTDILYQPALARSVEAIKTNFARNLKITSPVAAAFKLGSEIEIYASLSRVQCMQFHYKRLLNNRGAML